MAYNNKPSKKITRTCDACHKLLRLSEAYETLQENHKPSKYNKLCPKCFDKWLNGELK